MPNARIVGAAEELNRFLERTGAPARCDPALVFEAPLLAQALAVWREKTNGRQMPSRRDIDARALKAFLPNVCIVDVVDSEVARRFRFRLMGTTVARLLGDHTGKFFDEDIAPPFCERWTAMMNAAVGARGPLRLWGRLEYKGQQYLTMELLLAPIGARDEAIESILVVANAGSSSLHLFDRLVKNAVSAKVGV
jgi:hypothetical protein